MKIRIAIADDHPLVINGLKHLLANSADMEVIAGYTNGADLVDGVGKLQPDVLLLDIHMPGKTGDEAAELIREKYPMIKMIALTNQDNVYYIKNMLRSGAHGYVLKTTREDTLLEAIRTVYAGGTFLEPVLVEKMLADAANADAQADAIPVLSRREKDVLEFIAADLNSQQIADKLFISKRTVDSHRMSLLLKFGVKNMASLVKRAIQLGMIR